MITNYGYVDMGVLPSSPSPPILSPPSPHSRTHCFAMFACTGTGFSVTKTRRLIGRYKIEKEYLITQKQANINGRVSALRRHISELTLIIKLNKV